jgi:hypothetical protein
VWLVAGVYAVVGFMQVVGNAAIGATAAALAWTAGERGNKAVPAAAHVLGGGRCQGHGLTTAAIVWEGGVKAATGGDVGRAKDGVSGSWQRLVKDEGMQGGTMYVSRPLVARTALTITVCAENRFLCY